MRFKVMDPKEHIPRPERYAATGWAWILIPLAVIVWIAPVVWIQANNPRVLISWHGLLHTAIASRFPSEILVPENPFFAGEPLGYYWAHQALGWVISRLLLTDLLHGLRFVTLSGLVVLVVFAALSGRRYLGSTGAGLLIGYLALVGLNPLGPAIAVAKNLVKGTPLVHEVSGGAPETVFVTNQMADDYMAEPMLGALHLGSDWQYGQNIVWFLDITGRAPALALIMVLLFLALRREHKAWNVALMAFVVAGITSLDPLIGLALAGSLIGANGLVRFFEPGLAAKLRLVPSGLSLACLAGVVLALPTYYHILFLQESTLGLHSPSAILLGSATLALNFLVLAPLALAGAWQGRREGESVLSTVALAGFALLLVTPFISLKTGLGHDLTNAAQCLLALPATVAVLQWFRDHSSAGRRLTMALLLCSFLPTTALTLYSYTGRPAVPLGFEGQTLHRLPLDSPLEALYSWIRGSTSKSAVFVIDPSSPVKMAGNVSELPAFTARTLFTDHESYLIDSEPDAALRADIAGMAVSGHGLDEGQQEYLRGLTRPLFLISYRATEADLLRRLITLYGSPVFHKEFVAVFALDLPGNSHGR